MQGANGAFPVRWNLNSEFKKASPEETNQLVRKSGKYLPSENTAGEILFSFFGGGEGGDGTFVPTACSIMISSIEKVGFSDVLV